MSLTSYCACSSVHIRILGLLALVFSLPSQVVGQEQVLRVDSLYQVIRGDLEEVMASQAAYYLEKQEYAWNLQFLDFEPSNGVSVGISASRTGFYALGTHDALGTALGCSVYHGDIEPPDFPVRPADPEEISCTTGGPPPASDEPADVSAGPTFTPYTVAPQLKNSREVARAMERAYPPLLRDSGRGGTVRLWLFVDERGVLLNALVSQSSGNDALDRAALRVSRTMEFEPAMNDDVPVPVWVSFPVTFQIRRFP